MTTRKPSGTRDLARKVVQVLQDAGFTAYWAGGCVRDTLMGRTPKDYDVATDAMPDDVIGLFAKTNEIGRKFGIVQVILEGRPFEVATFRRDLGSSDGRHPDSVAFTDAEEDALRRDFTINGLFFDPVAERLLDFVGGREDIERRVVRAIGNPDERFREDHLRMLRAVRFASTLEFSIEPATADAMVRMAPAITKVSIERIQQELTRTLTESPHPGTALERLRESGLLEHILPEILPIIGQEQPPAFHPEGDVFTHTVMMLNAMESPSIELAYAVLFHDIGKPPTATLSIEPDGSERIRFNGHDRVGAEMTETIMKRLKMPSHTIEVVAHCVRNHMRFMEVPNMRRSTLRKLIGAPTFPIELELHRVDCLCSHGDLGNVDYLRNVAAEFESEPVLPSPWLSGHDVMKLGVTEGPQIGRWLEQAYQRQLEGLATDKDQLLAWLTETIQDNASTTQGS